MFEKSDQSTGISDTSSLPLYSIGAIAALSGVPTETIRIWERRYRLLEPSRSAGGHRQYSEADVVFLKALKVLTGRGMRIGTLAKRSRQDLLEAAGPLDAATGAVPKTAPPAAGAPKGPYAELIDEVIEVASRFDNAVVEALITRPLVQGVPSEVINNFYLPLLSRVGSLWHDGKIDIAVEHLLEKLVTTRIHALTASRPSAAFGPRALCACLPGELHEIGLLAASLRLRDLGFDVVYLGANLPISSLTAAIRARNPVLVVLSSTILPSRSVLDEISEAFVSEAFVAPKIILGGSAAPKIAPLFDGEAHVAKSLDDLEAFARERLDS